MQAGKKNRRGPVLEHIPMSITGWTLLIITDLDILIQRSILKTVEMWYLPVEEMLPKASICDKSNLIE